MNLLHKFDIYLMSKKHYDVNGFKRFVLEFLFFGIKQARACLFAFSFFLAMLLVPNQAFGLYRYDLLLIIAILLQVFMYFSKLESKNELIAICIFHFLGFCLEAFKTSVVNSWAYTEFAYTKIYGVPLFSGFMYASVASYIIQAYRIFDMRLDKHPKIHISLILSFMIYANFFTHHYIGDYRYYIAALLLFFYRSSFICFTPLDKERKMPLLVSFVLVGFFIWIAENFGTILGVWTYPNQIGSWALVSFSKWGSWSLVIVMSFTIVVSLKELQEKLNLNKKSPA
ncbi:DUF817 domain-containing protein [uncultured Campylobacter sp.]|uniref:DUF817 domain-containing protein n=1 Tax=uncultured Campylobacter sp. TaxID=218934 RepID=UPI0026261824|nr:DUF817 domain-containing protein [uncultured Campylobacter sp.]